jgi:hypothetical protein
MRALASSAQAFHAFGTGAEYPINPEIAYEELYKETELHKFKLVARDIASMSGPCGIGASAQELVSDWSPPA